jgi:CoA:oxalate CoA-transferase
MVVTMEDAEAGTLKLAGNPMKLSAFEDAKTRPPAPALNEGGETIRKAGFGKIKTAT